MGKVVNNPRTGRVLTIKRSKWVRGGYENIERYGYSELLNDKGRMCCLGFDAVACGVKRSLLDAQSEPRSLVKDNSEDTKNVPSAYVKTTLEEKNLSGSIYYVQKPVIDKAIRANDNEVISESVREARIRRHLIKLGWKDVKFVD